MQHNVKLYVKYGVVGVGVGVSVIVGVGVNVPVGVTLGVTVIVGVTLGVTVIVGVTLGVGLGGNSISVFKSLSGIIIPTKPPPDGIGVGIGVALGVGVGVIPQTVVVLFVINKPLVGPE